MKIIVIVALGMGLAANGFAADTVEQKPSETAQVIECAVTSCNAIQPNRTLGMNMCEYLDRIVFAITTEPAPPPEGSHGLSPRSYTGNATVYPKNGTSVSLLGKWMTAYQFTSTKAAGAMAKVKAYIPSDGAAATIVIEGTADFMQYGVVTMSCARKVFIEL